MDQNEQTEPEFSRPYRIGEIGDEDRQIELVASAAECAGLAKRFAVTDVDGLRATLVLRREGRRRIRLGGDIRAQVTQQSILSLEPVKSDLVEKLNILFCAEGDPLLEAIEAAEDGEHMVELMGDVERLECDGADLGEFVAQYLALAIDPYPREGDDVSLGDIGELKDVVERHRGAITFDALDPADPAAGKQNPFASLKIPSE